MARGDAVIANSYFTARLIADRYGTPERKITVIQRGFDPRIFEPALITPARVAAVRLSWGVRPEDRIILHPARLTSWKGQAVLIEAAARLAAQGHLGTAVVVLAGDPQGRTRYLATLQDQIASLGLRERVRLVGHVEDIAAAYLAVHVTIIASTDPEAFGRTAIEAAAMGCPVIATAIGAPPETVLAEPSVPTDGITGWLVPPGDREALADRLGAALTMSDVLRQEIGARARRHVQANFTVAGMQRQTLAVYDRLLGSGLERRFADQPAPGAPTGVFPLQS